MKPTVDADFLHAIGEATSIVIEGEKKSGKLTLAALIADLFSQKGSLLVSFYEKAIFEKRLSQMQSYLADSKIFDRLVPLFLKKGAKEFKRQYGLEVMAQDIERMIEATGKDRLILHRPDLFFDIQDYEAAEIFVDRIFAYAMEKRVCLIVTLDRSKEERHYLCDLFETISEMAVSIQKEDHFLVQIEDSTVPLRQRSYHFLIEKERLSLLPAQRGERQSEAPLSIERQKHIAIISEEKALIDLHTYLLFGEDFEIKSAQKVSAAFEVVLEKPDTIIYYERSDHIDLEICKLARKSHAKILYFLNRPFFRTQDVANALEKGCAQMFSIDFSFEEYITMFQKLHENFFYQARLGNFEPIEGEVSKEAFIDRLLAYWHARLFFTLVIVPQGAIKSSRVEASLRSLDFFCIEGEQLMMVVLNVRQCHIDPILQKIGIEGEQVHLTEAIALSQETIETL